MDAYQLSLISFCLCALKPTELWVGEHRRVPVAVIFPIALGKIFLDLNEYLHCNVLCHFRLRMSVSHLSKAVFESRADGKFCSVTRAQS
jgi:hypothetical protein